MSRVHTYQTEVVWTGNRGTGTSAYRAYDRAHEVSVPGRQPILSSSDPAFQGDPGRWNPELLLLASLSQCHMLWYLHLCADAGVVVTAYADRAWATMEETARGGHFTEAVLRPEVEVASPDMVTAATALHDDSHRACFIAASVNFPVRHEPSVSVRGSR